MPRTILFRNDETDQARKSYWVYQNVEQALAQAARAAGREVTGGFALDGHCTPRRGTAYASTGSVISIGLAAHERLADVIRSSLIYLDPDAGRPAGAEAARLAACGGRARAASRLVFLGRRARQAAAFLPREGARPYDLPPVDLSGLPRRAGDAPRLAIINHLADEGLARAVTRRFLDGSDLFLDCHGLAGERHNRVRYVGDAEVGDAGASVHIHVGVPAGDGDRLRVCDSWQSSVPVLFFDVADAGPGVPAAVRDEHDVLACRSYEEACGFLALLLDTPSLRRLLVANGRASAAPAARAWGEIARDLAA